MSVNNACEGLGGAEVLKYWGEFVRKQRDEEVKRHWGLEKACCVACFSIATHTCGLFAAADLSLSLYPDYSTLTVDRMWHNGLHKNPWLYYTGARKWKRHTHTKKQVFSVFLISCPSSDPLTWICSHFSFIFVCFFQLKPEKKGCLFTDLFCLKF